jgi:hypothetical protein
METPQMKFVKKGLLGLVAIGMMAGCQEANVQTKRTKVVLSYGSEPLEMVTIEGCEYIVSPSTNYYKSLCHKGNCKNPIHPENKSHE